MSKKRYKSSQRTSGPKKALAQQAEITEEPLRNSNNLSQREDHVRYLRNRAFWLIIVLQFTALISVIGILLLHGFSVGGFSLKPYAFLCLGSVVLAIMRLESIILKGIFKIESEK
jgi:hypothetical protein